MIHFHHYEPIAVRHVRVYDDSWGRDRFGHPVTEILKKCACGKVKVKEIQGTWTLDQIR